MVFVGWGDAFAYSCLSAVTGAIRDMVAPLVVGREIEDIAAFNLELQKRLHLHGRYGITIFAIGGVDIALWDAAAKAKGVSLARLLGGRRRNSVPAYASLVRYSEPAVLAKFAARAVAEGYRDVKLHEITLEAIEAGRKAVGPDVRLTTDVNCNWSAADAERLLPHMKRLDLYWVEEPLFPPDDAAALGALERKFGVAIASGENACTSVEFARTVPAIRYTQPSVTKVGGVSEFVRSRRDGAGAGPHHHAAFALFRAGLLGDAATRGGVRDCRAIRVSLHLARGRRRPRPAAADGQRRRHPRQAGAGIRAGHGSDRKVQGRVSWRQGLVAISGRPSTAGRRARGAITCQRAAIAAAPLVFWPQGIHLTIIPSRSIPILGFARLGVGFETPRSLGGAFFIGRSHPSWLAAR